MSIFLAIGTLNVGQYLSTYLTHEFGFKLIDHLVLQQVSQRISNYSAVVYQNCLLYGPPGIPPLYPDPDKSILRDCLISFQSRVGSSVSLVHCVSTSRLLSASPYKL